MKPIYLDHNATTPVLPEVIEAMAPFWNQTSGNPSSRHQHGRYGRRALDEARECIADNLGSDPDEIIFTSGGTESNHLAIFGITQSLVAFHSIPSSSAAIPKPRAITSTIEHPSVMECFHSLEKRDWIIDRISVDSQGRVILSSLNDVIHHKNNGNTVPSPADKFSDLQCNLPRLVSVMLANNETGAIQPVKEIVEMVQSHAIPVHTDAVQAIGKIAIDFHDLGVSSLSLGAHKFHGPKGIGALIVHRDCPLSAIFQGGHQQSGHRAGTEPVPLIVGMAKALELACKKLEQKDPCVSQLAQHFHDRLMKTLPGLVINSPPQPYCLLNTLNVSFPGVDAQLLLMALDLNGISCSVGSACASGSTQPSPVLKAMKLSKEVINSAVRFSFGSTNTLEEVNEAVERIVDVVQQQMDLLPVQQLPHSP